MVCDNQDIAICTFPEGYKHSRRSDKTVGQKKLSHELVKQHSNLNLVNALAPLSGALM